MKRFLFFGLKATIQRAAYNTWSLAVTEGHTNDTFSTFGKKNEHWLQKTTKMSRLQT